MSSEEILCFCLLILGTQRLLLKVDNNNFFVLKKIVGAATGPPKIANRRERAHFAHMVNSTLPLSPILYFFFFKLRILLMSTKCTQTEVQHTTAALKAATHGHVPVHLRFSIKIGTAKLTRERCFPFIDKRVGSSGPDFWKMIDRI